MDVLSITTPCAEMAICTNPIFIIGSDRSGTSVLARSLARHSQLWASDETDVLFDLFGRGKVDIAYKKAIERPTGNWLQKEQVDKTEFFEYLGMGLNTLFTSRSGGKRWIDHTPCYTRMVDTLAQMYPGAQFLHMIRDGRRVVHSMTNILNSFNDKQAMIDKGYVPKYVDFEVACRTWRELVEIACDFCMRHTARCLTVVNERVMADAASEFERIFDFLGVPHEPVPAEYFATTRTGSSHGKGSRDLQWVRQLPDPWNHWTEIQREIFRREAGLTLLKCGFATAEELGLSDYGHVALRIRATVQELVPRQAKILVGSKGDDHLLDLDGRYAAHFPQGNHGEYFGGHPTDDAQAIDQLERLRSRGFNFFIIPATTLWWLEYYPRFRDHLDSRYRCVWTSWEGVIFHLEGPSNGK